MKQRLRLQTRGNDMPTPQMPVDSEFGAASTAAEVIRGISLRGKTAIVTGGYSGIGLETVRVFVTAGAHVIVPARSRTKADDALKGLRDVEIESMELSDPKSVNDFADRFLASDRALHILVDNAGIMAPPLQRDKRCYELQLSTNYLGHFQLTARLLPALMGDDIPHLPFVEPSPRHLPSPVRYN
ncbi:MAG TPA: SDR family NAD(P)-dependent oxidoreductase [Steroidobacteraceae bacterium]|nr:SDR family NAD(P)-dependent oxidoreductase [Steroidobacteraceae bacterium]